MIFLIRKTHHYLYFSFLTLFVMYSNFIQRHLKTNLFWSAREMQFIATQMFILPPTLLIDIILSKYYFN